MSEKRIKIPAELLIEEGVKKVLGQLASLEGVTKSSSGTNWKYIKSKGGWQYLGSIADTNIKTNTYAVIPDATEEELSTDAKEIESSAVKASLNRIEEKVQNIEALVGDTWNYTMLSFDNRVLKIGETRWEKEPGELKAALETRYRKKEQRAKGGPFRYVAHKPGTDKTEASALAWLKKCGVKPLYGEEYFHSHEALKALRDYGSWCLGEWATEGGFLPPIQEAEQRELNL